MKNRAYTEEDKLKKRDGIIAAAKKLLTLGKFQLPSINQIIDETGDAKGTVYLYFKTKEEIYLSLLAEGLKSMMKEVLNLIQSRPPNLPKKLAKKYTELAAAQPKIFYLACIAPIILESNVSEEFIIAFKKSLLHDTNLIAQSMLDMGYFSNIRMARTKILITYNTFLGMWLHSHPPDSVLNILKKQNLLDLQYDFENEISNSFERLFCN